MVSSRVSDHGFAHIVMIGLVILVITLVGAIVFKKQHNMASSGSDCVSKERILQNPPVKLEEISTIVPLGNLAPPGHVLPTTHMYYNYIHTDNGPNKTTLYVPADMTVTQMMKMDNNDLDKPYEAYRIDFKICKDVTGYFILVQKLNDALAAAMQPPYDRTQESDVGKAKRSHNDYKEVEVKLKAGEVLGWAGGERGYPDGLDFALIDKRIPNPVLANLKRWPDSERHYVCTLDYYSSDVSKQLYAKIGDFGGMLRQSKVLPCGTIYQDVPNTVQGIWMSKDSDPSGLWDVGGSLALVHSNYDSTRGVISIGNMAQQLGMITSSIYSFDPTTKGAINLDFSLVRDDKTYCYEVDSGTGSPNSKISILIQLVNSVTLRLAKNTSVGCGLGPWDMDKYLEYVR